MSITGANPRSRPLSLSTWTAAAANKAPGSSAAAAAAADAEGATALPIIFASDGIPIPVSDDFESQSTRGSIGDKSPAFALDTEQDSELSDPDSTVQTPPRLHELSEEIVAQSIGTRSTRSTARGFFDQDQDNAPNAQEPPIPHYPRQKRASILSLLDETTMETPNPNPAEHSNLPSSFKVKARRGIEDVKGVLIGHWRDSPVPHLQGKHAVTAFLDSRDRLRIRIQPITKVGETIHPSKYPVPSGPGGSWITFDRVCFCPHLIGLNHFQIKEYVRLRAKIAQETGQEEIPALKDATSFAIVKGRQMLQLENPSIPPLIARGASPTDGQIFGIERAPKRHCTDSSFQPPSQDNISLAQKQSPLLDPLHGTRPTRIVLGYWRGSSEPNPSDRHAVYGILGQNDMFRLRVVRETRDGRYVDGNFPSAAGAIWIHFDEIELEPHIKTLSRPEIKQYCRIRQYQIDHGETFAQRRENELHAATDAHTAPYISPHHHSGTDSFAKKNYTPRNLAVDSIVVGAPSDAANSCLSGSHEMCEPRNLSQKPATPRRSLGLDESSSTVPTVSTTNGVNRLHSTEAIERANALARREIARIEAAQNRADRHAIHSQRAAEAASGALANENDDDDDGGGGGDGDGGRILLHESEEIGRLNRVWERQESRRLQAELGDCKIYAGVKYERKPTGPLMGKLVSQGSIITIDGEDYVEYRVLTKPSFF